MIKRNYNIPTNNGMNCVQINVKNLVQNSDKETMEDYIIVYTGPYYAL